MKENKKNKRMTEMERVSRGDGGVMYGTIMSTVYNVKCIFSIMMAARSELGQPTLLEIE